VPGPGQQVGATDLAPTLVRNLDDRRFQDIGMSGQLVFDF
jgi:hypothetical protein